MNRARSQHSEIDIPSFVRFYVETLKHCTSHSHPLHSTQADDIQRMETDLEARRMVAGAALAAVEQMNASEKMAFLTSCNNQRQHLQSLIAWEFRQLLATQQQILTSAGIPLFEGATASSLSIYKQSMICSFLHSAFFLRNRIGEKAHVTMLQSQEAKLASQPLTSMPVPPGLGQEESIPMAMPPYVPQPQMFPQQGSFPPIPIPPPAHNVQYR